MARRESNDTRPTADLEAPTAAVREVAPPDEEDAPPATHRRGPGLWLPLAVFGALLVAAAVVGRFVVPAGGPDPGAAPQPQAEGDRTPGAPTFDATLGPTLPLLPTPPIRPADALADWAGRVAAVIGVPIVAIQAYGYAQLHMQTSDPQCRLGWTTLAGVGEVESHHGQAAGAVLEPAGRSTPVIVGPVLNGQDGRALVRDTDGGAFDGDVTFDRAMGPMHLLSSVWRTHAIDADADGILDPFDIDDASLTLARFLCSGPEDLGRLADWNAAIGRHHSGDAYARSVFQAADGYGQRTRGIT